MIAAAKNIDEPTLTRVLQELMYCIGVCRVTRSAHIEYLWSVKEIFFSFPAAMNISSKVIPLVSLL
jgi:hypothetical protein